MELTEAIEQQKLTLNNLKRVSPKGMSDSFIDFRKNNTPDYHKEKTDSFGNIIKLK